MANELGQMVVSIVGDTAKFNEAIKQSENKLSEFGKSAQTVGKNLSLFVTTPIIAMGAAAVAAIDGQLQAEAQLANALRATGRESENTVKSIAAYASELQKTTLYGDEVTVQAAALVQQLANLDENGLKAVLPRMQDFATAMGVDLQTAASLVGKTLGTETNALARYGIEIDTSASKTEKLAQLTAQLDAKFKGAAATAAATGLGPLKQLQNAVGDLGEQFGAILIPIVQDVVKNLQGFVDTLSKMDDEQRKTILTVAGVAAAIGPLLLIVGKTITTFQAAKAAVIAMDASTKAFMSTVGIAVAALAGFLLILNGIGAAINQLNITRAANDFKELAKQLGITKEQADAFLQDAIKIEDAFDNIGKTKEFGFLGLELVKIDKTVKSQLTTYNGMFNAVQRIANEEGKSAKQVALILANSTKLTPEMREQAEIVAKQADEQERLTKQYQEYAAARRGEIKEEEDSSDGSKDAAAAWEKTWNLVNQTIDANKTNLQVINEQIAAVNALGNGYKKGSSEYLYIEQKRAAALVILEKQRKDIIAQQNAELAKQNAIFGDEVVAATEETTEVISRGANNAAKAQREAAEETLKAWQQAADSIQSTYTNLSNSIISLGSVLYSNQKQNIDMEERDKLASLELQKNAEIAAAGDNADAKKAIEEKYAAEQEKIQKEMAQKKYQVELAEFNTMKAFKIAQTIIDTAAAIVKALPNIPLSIAAGVAGAAQTAAIIAQQPPSPPALAEGGIVMPSTKGTLARVAEAGQPEVIFPLDDLNRFLDTGRVGTGDAGGDISLVVQLDSKPILEKIFPATKNRTVLISAGAVV